MAAKSPSRIFTTVFSALLDQSLKRGDEVVDDCLNEIAQQLYELSKEYGYDASLSEDELSVLGVEL